MFCRKRMPGGFMAVLMAVLILGTAAFSSFPSYCDWMQDEVGWWYQTSDGGYLAGVSATINGKDYVFDSDGYLITNRWVESSNGNWYYCTGSGALAKNQWIGDSYYVDGEGRMLSDGKYTVSGREYIFDGDGKIYTDAWAKSDGKWYYCMGSGEIAKNRWIEDTYYVGSNGAMLTDTWVGDYYVGTDGRWDPGKSRLNFKGDWIYGSYSNVDSLGFNEDNYATLRIYYDKEFKRNTVNMGLYQFPVSSYNFYDTVNPNGDNFMFAGYKKGTYTIYSDKMTIASSTNAKYKLVYDGLDTITLYWKKVAWNPDVEGKLVFKKTEDYYPEDSSSGYAFDTVKPSWETEEETEVEWDDVYSSNPFSGGRVEIKHSASDEDLETTDVTVHEVVR